MSEQGAWNWERGAGRGLCIIGRRAAAWGIRVAGATKRFRPWGLERGRPVASILPKLSATAKNRGHSGSRHFVSEQLVRGGKLLPKGIRLPA